MDADRLQYVAARFRQLQGYVWLPFAVVFLLSFLYQAGWLPLPGADSPQIVRRWYAGAFSVALIAGYGVQQWYGATFGLPTPQIMRSAWGPILIVLVYLFAAVSIQEAAGLRVSLAPVVMSAAFAVVGARHYPLRHHYLVPAALFMGLALLGTFGVAQAARSMPFDLVIALSLTIVGIGDHRLFASAFPTVRARQGVHVLPEVHAGA